ncbi:hypothetical protein B0I37DRAFT_449627 [Chaetomium sp. MPI-CAGE-AT-0009]|nr:hypothetical protein B0I37DRAFT_449627 [Chaetomium sp. MPI-CAGE-AT-0009]
MPLTALDYTAPQNYMMKSLIFPFPSILDSDRQPAVTYLKGRLARVFALVPPFAGQMIHARDGELPRLVYSDKAGESNLDRFPNEVFDYQVLDSAQFPWTFDELSALGVPAATMTKDLLWLLPKTGPAPGDACHPITLANKTLSPSSPAPPKRTPPLHPKQPTTSPPFHSTNPPPAIAKIFTLPDARVRTLHAAALSHLRAAHGAHAFASPSDIVCALAWLHVTRARLRAGRVTPADTTRLATAVSIRGKLEGGEDGGVFVGGGGNGNGGYLGNMWLRALAGVEVAGLVGGGGDDSGEMGAPVTVERVADAAWCVRRAVVELVRPETLRSHLALAARATDLDGAVTSTGERERVAWPEVDAAVRRCIARHHTGLDVSVGVGLGADVEFEIPGVNGGEKTKATWVRRAYVANDGAMSLLPRRGGTKGDRDWEIWLALREEDMRVVEEEGELGGWLSRPAA